jgi:hypothetical protein
VAEGATLAPDFVPAAAEAGDVFPRQVPRRLPEQRLRSKVRIDGSTDRPCLLVHKMGLKRQNEIVERDLVKIWEDLTCSSGTGY